VSDYYLIGKRISLRPLAKTDLPTLVQWTNDPAVTQFMNIGTFPNTLDAFEYEFDLLTSEKTGALLQLPNYPKNLIFAICRNDNDQYIGNVGIFGLNWIHRVAELRVLIGQKDQWGKGIAAESYSLAAGYAFSRLNMRRLWAGARADNIGSIRALEKIGFVREGAWRRNIILDERAYDTVLVGMLREEFKPAIGTGR
jgi:RimJ/RimL family protein N-acetyltransferase